MTVAPIPRRSVADVLAERLKDAILDGGFPPGAPLREVALAAMYDVSRHTVRSALKAVEVDGLVTILPQRGAFVATLDVQRLADLFALRTALELEGAYLAFARNGGRLPESVHEALAALVAAAGRARPSWRAVADRHAALHSAIVRASESPRIVAAYDGLAAEMQLFLVQLRPVWPLEKMGPHHQELIRGLEAHGPEVLRGHINDGLDAVRPVPAAAPPARD